jgi:hypothetical protein
MNTNLKAILSVFGYWDLQVCRAKGKRKVKEMLERRF